MPNRAIQTTTFVSVWFVASVLFASTAAADLEEQRAYSRYDVPVQPGKSLREQLSAASPVRSNGHIYHAYTKWNVSWHYQFVILASGRCGIDSEHTVLTVTMTLPAPKDPAIAEDPVFRKYLAALEVHEQGHYQIGRSTALAIDQGILTLPSQDSCQALTALATALADEQLGNARITESRYDRDTGFGRTQGAALD